MYLLAEVETSFETRSRELAAQISESVCDAKRRRSGMSETFRKGRRAIWSLRRRGQAIKSARGMPWHQEPMKDVTSCDKLRGGANIR